MAITTVNGIFMPAMSQAKKFAETGNQISGPEMNTLVTMMRNALINEYEGATSEHGLADDRDILAKTAQAIMHNVKGKWGANPQAIHNLELAFGRDLDAKNSGSIAKLEQHIRNQVRTPSGYSYWG